MRALKDDVIAEHVTLLKELAPSAVQVAARIRRAAAGATFAPLTVEADAMTLDHVLRMAAPLA